MFANKFQKNPIRIHILNKYLKHQQTYVMIGNVPKNIKIALCDIEKNNFDSKIVSKHKTALKDFYGNRFEEILNLSKKSKLGGDIDVSLDDLTVDVEENLSKNKIEFDEKEIDELLNDSKDLNDIKDLDEPIKGKSLASLVTTTEKIELDTKFTGETKFSFDLSIYPEDKISDVKAKIQINSKIPIYRQHLFWKTNSIVNVPYVLYSEGIQNINLLQADYKNNLIGIPIDKPLYADRDQIKIEAKDLFLLMENLQIDQNELFVVDLADYINSQRMQLMEIIQNTYQFELLYFGFIIKYFPMMTKEVFYDYINSENELYQKYPDLAIPTKNLETNYSAEANIINKNYALKDKITNLIYGNSPINKYGVQSKYINISITNMIATVQTNKRNPINIRNLFEKLHVSRCRPQIHAYIDYKNKKYLLRKQHIRNQSDIQFPAIFRSGLTIAVSLLKEDQDSFHKKSSLSTIENEQSRYLFVNVQPSGQYFVKAIWNEEDNRNFEDVITIIRKFTADLINEINGFSKYIFVSSNYEPMPLISKYNIYFQNLSISVFWKKLVTEQVFRFLRTLWQPYIDAGLISIRGIQQSGTYEFTYKKGITEFDMSIIERVLAAASIDPVSNFYTSYSNSTIKQKFEQLYGGRVVKMSHRTVDVKFEILNIREQEFDIFFMYLAGFIIKAMNNPELHEIAKKKQDYGDFKKLKKLRETDPELINLRKHGSKKVYSILCQNPRQPIIYTEDEINQLNEKEKKKLVKFWNFTLNKEAYYACKSSKYPRLSFIVGVHPKHYCLPCCGKSTAQEDSKKNYINNICMTKHLFYAEDAKKSKKHDDIMIKRHIMNYGKDIETGRLSRLPNSAIKQLLFNTADEDEEDKDQNKDQNKYQDQREYLIFGVQQILPSNVDVGILYCLSLAFGDSVQNIVDKISNLLKKKPELFNTLLNGILIDSFDNMSDLISTMKILFSEQKLVDFYQRTKFSRWSELFIELAMILFNLFIITFIDSDGKGETTDLFISDFMRNELIYSRTNNEQNEYLMIIKRLNYYYPIFLIKPSEYFKTGEIFKKTFKNKEPIIEHIFSIISSSFKEFIEYNNPITLTILKNILTGQKYKIEEKYINSSNLCYAVLIGLGSKDTSKIYFPIENSPNIMDELKPNYDVFSRHNHNIPRDKLDEFIKFVNSTIEKNFKVTDKTYSVSKVEIDQYRIFQNQIIGFISKNSFKFYFNPIVGDLKNQKYIKVLYEDEEVNKAIIKRQPGSIDNTNRIGESLYKNYLYELFLLEFINAMEKERNKEIRSTIHKNINDHNFKTDINEFYEKTKKIMNDNDFSIIKDQIREFYLTFSKKKFHNLVDESVYDFDKMTLNRLLKLSKNSLKAELKEICKNFSEVGKFSISSDKIKFPNIYIPCEYSEEKSFCVNKKLLIDSEISGQTYENLIDLLANDIKNPLKIKYILNGIIGESVVDYFNFTDVKYEIITIFKLQYRK